MKILYLECNMGISGDMLMSALWELTDDKKSLINIIDNIGLRQTDISFNKTQSHAISGTQASVVCGGFEECEGCYHNDFSHAGIGDIKQIINGLNIPDEVKENALKTYDIIAEAESRVHNTTVENIHFHELGTLDAVADVVVCSYLLYVLNPDKVVCSPINCGSGNVKCAHGVLPVPAPATAYILKNIPVYSNEVEGELCTPTGAALAKNFADEFSVMPCMTVDKIGYGIGSKDFSQANCLRAFIGSDVESKVTELAFNIDDMTAEDLGFACRKLMENGALDVYQTPAAAKKFRLATVVSVICDERIKGKMLELIFKHTTTIGVREYELERYTLKRKVGKISTTLGEFHQITSEGFGVNKTKLEFDDLKKFAELNDLSIEEVRKLISK